MTAKEQLIEVRAKAMYEFSLSQQYLEEKAPRFADLDEENRVGWTGAAEASIDIDVAHPDLLLAVLAETGVLTEESRPQRALIWTDAGTRRYVSPWVPSGDQT